jgi:hypothetical protein
MKDVVAVGEERLVLRGADALAVGVELGPPEAAGVRLVPDHDVDDAGVAAQQAADEGAVGVACGVGLRGVGRGAVDREDDAEVRAQVARIIWSTGMRSSTRRRVSPGCQGTVTHARIPRSRA